MDVFNQVAARVANLYRSSTVGARLTVGLLLAVAVISLACLGREQVSGPDSYLFEGEPISAGQIPAMEAAFAKAGLNDFQVEGNRIKILHGNGAAYMAALADAGAMPPNFGNYMDEMLKRINPLTNRAQQEEMIKVARQNELSLIIQSMKGIERATVLYDTQKKTGLHGGILATASVNIKPSGNKSLDGEQVESLRNLLAGAIAGLDPHSVAVTDLNSGETYYSSPDDPLGTTDDYALRKRDYEHMWSEKIRQSLAMIPNAIVTVNVELDPDIVNQQTRIEYDPRPESRSHRESKAHRDADGNQSGGRTDAPAGDADNPVAKLASLLGQTGTTLAGVEDDGSEIGAAGSSTSKVVKAPLRPLQATVAVGIPSSYIERVWRRQHSATSGAVAEPTARALADLQAETISRVTAHVKNLLPRSGEKRDSRLNVTVTVFPDVAEKTELPEPAASAYALDWAGRHGGSLGLGCLAVFSLLMLRSTVRSILAPAASPIAHGGVEIGPTLLSKRLDGGHEPVPLTTHAARGQSASVPSPRDELAEMVREDPGAAARILRTWIGGTG